MSKISILNARITKLEKAAQPIDPNDPALLKPSEILARAEEIIAGHDVSELPEGLQKWIEGLRQVIR